MVKPRPRAAARFVEHPRQIGAAFFAADRDVRQRELLGCRIAIVLGRNHLSGIGKLGSRLDWWCRK
jgi:hypothetical protein